MVHKKERLAAALLRGAVLVTGCGAEEGRSAGPSMPDGGDAIPTLR